VVGICNLVPEEMLNPSENGEAMPELVQDDYRSYSTAEHEPVSNLAPRWFAVYTAPRHEKRIAEHFEQRHIEAFLPVYRSRRYWKDGSKTVLELPLFPSYIFVHIALANRVPVLEVPGVLALVSCGRCPVPLPDLEVETLREGLAVCKAEPHPYLVVGERVRVRVGPFAGMEGVLLRKSNNFRVVLTMMQIMQSVAIEVNESDVESATSSDPQQGN
jgi:transcription antitermination factor NusG